MNSDSLTLVEQLAIHLESAQTAGVEWVARSSAPAEFRLPAPPAETRIDTTPQDPLAVRRTELKVLSERVEKCTACSALFSTRLRTVFGLGPLNPEVCFLAAAPTTEDEEAGEPLRGAAGETFDRMLSKIGFQRDEVYICQVVKCRTPSRQPNATECSNCRPFLAEQMRIVQPKLICTLGEVAAKSLLHESRGLELLRGRTWHFQGFPVLCTYHPADFRHNPKLKIPCWDDLQQLLKTLGRQLPAE